MNVFHKKATLLWMIIPIIFPFIRCQGGTTLSDNKNDKEVSAIRECLTKCLKSRKDMSLFTEEKYLRIMCEKHRMKKTEFGCGSGNDSNAVELLKDCLIKESEPATYDHYFNQGKKLHAAREFMKKESLSEIPPPILEEEPSVESNQESNQESNENETMQYLWDDLDIDYLFKVTPYSTFTDGLCYKRYLFNSNQDTSNVNCSISCVDKLFNEIERVLVEEFAKIKKPTDQSLVSFQPEANIFEIVCRLTGVKTIEKLAKLGEKWSINYTKAYRNIKYHYSDEIGKLEEALKLASNSNRECIQHSCPADFSASATKKLLFYDWMNTDLKLDDSHYYDANDDNSKILRDSQLKHDNDLKQNNSRYHDADDDSKMLRDSHAYQDSHYHDAPDDSKMEDFSTNRTHKLSSISENPENQDGSAQKRSVRRKIVHEPNSESDFQEEKKIK